MKQTTARESGWKTDVINSLPCDFVVSSFADDVLFLPAVVFHFDFVENETNKTQL